MIEKAKFIFSGSVKDPSNLEEIIFWGHDAGEFSYEELETIIEQIQTEADLGKNPNSQKPKSDTPQPEA